MSMAKFVCDGREFQTPARIAMKLDLFRYNLSLQNRTYTVKSVVTADAFSEFLSYIKNDTVKQVRYEGDEYECGMMRDLCDEFGYHGLSFCDEFDKPEEPLGQCSMDQSQIELLRDLRLRVESLELFREAICKEKSNEYKEIQSTRNKNMIENACLFNGTGKRQEERSELGKKELLKLKEMNDAIDALSRRVDGLRGVNRRVTKPNMSNGVIAKWITKNEGKSAMHEDDSTISVSASSSMGVSNILDFDNPNSSYASVDEPGQWICCHFRKARVSVKGYTIRTASVAHLKSWIVEGSEDGSDGSWVALDRRDSDAKLDGRWIAKTYEAKDKSVSPLYKYVRLRQTDKNHSGTNQLFCSAFEIFGNVLDVGRSTKTSYKARSGSLDGIIAALRNDVEVTASTSFEPRNVLDRNTDSYYQSCQGIGQWLCIEFQSPIEPTWYWVRGRRDDMRVMASWVLEGSNDKVSWVALDVKHDNCDLKRGMEKGVMFNISARGAFKFIRLRMVGKNHDGTDILALSAIDLFVD